MLRLGCAVLLLCGMLFSAGAAGAQSETLAKVRARGHVICGVSNNSPGFSKVDKSGKWSGFEVEFCAALAAAALGNAEAVKYRPLTAGARFKALQSGEIDVLVHNTSWTLGRVANFGIRYVSPLFYEGTGLVVRREQDIASAMELTGAAVCTLGGTSAERSVAYYFSSRKMSYENVTFDTWDEAVKAFKSKRCQVLSADMSMIASQLSSMPDNSDYMILPELIAQEPLSPAVRTGDEGWFEIVRWTIFALVKGEELGLSSLNIDKMRARAAPHVRQFLGIDRHIGTALELPGDWTYQVIRQVGNYREIFARNFGSSSPLKMQRKLNRLWVAGGLLSAPSFR